MWGGAAAIVKIEGQQHQGHDDDQNCCPVHIRISPFGCIESLLTYKTQQGLFRILYPAEKSLEKLRYVKTRDWGSVRANRLPSLNTEIYRFYWIAVDKELNTIVACLHAGLQILQVKFNIGIAVVTVGSQFAAVFNRLTLAKPASKHGCALV